ncbi:MAG: serralysin, partial [Sphingomonadales bacterium]|nr:serralysin [Sphingomonadales bacterium]
DGPSVPNANGENGGLEQGGYAFYTLVHEFGHGMGLAHPHDTGGGSTVLPGVFGPFGTGVAGSYGAFDLNQGVYSVMSYNPGWDLNPANAPYGVPWYIDGPGVYREIDEAYNGGLSAFDIALLQIKYGANTGYNVGNDVYVLPAANVGDAFFQTIWDAGGTDTIVHNGTQSALIDLNTATIDMTATGGGVISQASGVYGGFTIARNVVIENATGGSGNDTLIGNGADNVLDGRGGADQMAGRLGNDRYVVDNGGDVVTELAGQGTDTVASSITYTLGTALENLELTGAGAINGTGNELDNVITGNGAANVLTGLAGNDTLNGGAGGDSLTGGTGNDLYVVDDAGDVVTEAAGEGTDTVSSSISYTLTANVENLVLTGTATDGTGNGLDNVITGNAASNRLDGGAGADTMIGGLGNDLYFVDNGGDVVTEAAGEGTDTVSSSISYTLGANVENLILTGTATDGTGNGLDNVITGNAAANRIDGGAGADTMAGGLGDDLYFVENGGDVATEGAGEGTDTVASSISYTLGANVENLILTGSGLNGTGNGLGNVITGDAGSNRLDGGAGNDRLIGGDGVDYFTGGAGADTFVGEINATTSDMKDNKGGSISLDVILDYQRGSDKIDLSGIDANTNVAGDQAFTWTNSANPGIGQLSIRHFGNMNAAESSLGLEIDGVDGKSPYSGAVDIVFGNVDGGNADFAIAFVSSPQILVSDFVL